MFITVIIENNVCLFYSIFLYLSNNCKTQDFLILHATFVSFPKGLPVNQINKTNYWNIPPTLCKDRILPQNLHFNRWTFKIFLHFLLIKLVLQANVGPLRCPSLYQIYQIKPIV